MSEGDYFTAALAIQETRAACPERRTLTAHAAELLAVEGECELYLGRAESASALTKAAIEIAHDLPFGQKATAMESLAHTAVRLSAAGNWSFAQHLFEAAVAAMETSAPGNVAAEYRTVWAEALYANGKLAESTAVLAPLDSAALGFSADIETLRAQLLLADDRSQDAILVLNPLLAAAEEGLNEVVSARSRALRSWAFFRIGILNSAVEDARKACDVLMPLEHPDAAPALLTLAISLETENMDAAEAFLQESSRLICESPNLSPFTKASRLSELARSLLHAGRTDWAKRLLDEAARMRTQTGRRPVYLNEAIPAEAPV